jgi:hypothetical protein
MKNFQEQNSLADEHSTSSSPALRSQTSSHNHSFKLPERFCGDPFHLKQRVFNKQHLLSVSGARAVHHPMFCISIGTEISLGDVAGNYMKRDVQIEDATNTSNACRIPPSIDFETFLRTVDQAAKEILIIGREHRQTHIAQEMSNSLLEMKEKDERLILEYCIKLYTRSSFLFRACHRDLGDYYSIDDEKLSHYIELVNLYINRYGKSYTGIVYRGAMLNDEKRKLHLTSDIHTVWYSPTYLSTSKSRQIAEMYGNVLIIIDIEKSINDRTEKAVDISELSAIPDEEEVLLTPKYLLSKVKHSEFDPILKKNIIYLTSTHSSISPVIRSDGYNHRKTKQKLKYNRFSSTPKDPVKETNETDSSSENEFNLSLPIVSDE